MKTYRKGSVEMGLSGTLYYISVEDSRKNTILLGLGIQELLNIQEGIDELLDTHTVKEPNINYPIPNSLKFVPDGTASLEFKYDVAEPSDTVKEDYIHGKDEECDKSCNKEEKLCVNCEKKEARVGLLCDYCRSEGWKEEPTTPEKTEYSPRPQGDSWKDGVKSQKATPEKKCCDGCGIWYNLSETGERKRGCINTNCDCHKKLPTSSYEVTCGRCEKSIKHSCGVVRDWQSEREDYYVGK